MSHGRADLSSEVTNLVSTIVVAGGSGLRFGQRKQFALLSGESVLDHTLATVRSVSHTTVVVVPGDAVASTQHQVGAHDDVVVVAGGNTRAESVRAGLGAVDASSAVVLVHDAARPLASVDLFTRVIAAVIDGAVAVIPVVELSDSIRHVDGQPVDRSELRAVQTPQGFRPAELRAAHESGQDATDDATLVSALGHRVETVDGEPENTKLTVPIDLVIAEAILRSRQTSTPSPPTGAP